MTTPAPLRWVERRPKSRLHEPRVAALLGIALGVAFVLCFGTGVLSHLIQQPPAWFHWPSRPAGFYRISQGIHVTAGFVTIPLLLAKLWIVYPKLFEWPPVTSVVHALERLSLLPLIGGGLFMVVSGTFNVARWYPWGFFFPLAHYWVGWITIGSLAIHLGAKWTIVREQTGRGHLTDDLEPDRRRFVAGVAATGATVFLAVAGNTIGPLSALAVLAQRRPGTGPQGLPVTSRREARASSTERSPPTTAWWWRAEWNAGSSSPSPICRHCRSGLPTFPSPASKAGVRRASGPGYPSTSCCGVPAHARGPRSRSSRSRRAASIAGPNSTATTLPTSTRCSHSG